MEQLRSQRTGFHEIWYLYIFRRSVEKVEVSLKHDKHDGYFTGGPVFIFDQISPSSSHNEICFRQSCRENQNTRFIVSNFCPGNRAFYQYDACVLHDVYLMLQTHTQNMQYLLLFHGNSDYTSARQCYVIRRPTLLVLYVHCLWLGCSLEGKVSLGVSYITTFGERVLFLSVCTGDGSWCSAVTSFNSTVESNLSLLWEKERRFIRKFSVFALSSFLVGVAWKWRR